MIGSNKAEAVTDKSCDSSEAESIHLGSSKLTTTIKAKN